jgi:anti-sigma28 factor (negative regulator of flagellin synthesis)
MTTKPSDKPLAVKVSNGMLTIEIGTGTLAFSALCSAYAWQLTDPERTGKEVDPRTKFTVTGGFTIDVKNALLEEAEDGSSLLTRMLDEACRKAIEDGSEYFVDKAEIANDL